MFVVSGQPIWFHDEESSASYVGYAYEFSRLGDFGNAKGSSIGAPKIFLVLPANKSFEIQAPDIILRSSEIQGRKGDFYRCSPAMRGDPSPNSVPSRIQVSTGRIALLLHDQAVGLSAERVNLKNIGTTTIMVRVDQNLEVMRTSVFSVGDSPSYGSRWRKLLTTLADCQSGSSTLPLSFGG